GVLGGGVVPGERIRDGAGAVGGLRGTRAGDRGRPGRPAAVQSSQRRDRDRLSACLELHVRDDVAGGRCAATTRYVPLCFDYVRARCRVPRSRDSRVRRHDRPRRDAANQRVPFRVLHRCRLSRLACHRRTDLVGGDDGPGRNQGIPPERRPSAALLCPVLACARYHLGLAVYGRLSDGSSPMTDAPYDLAPGDVSIFGRAARMAASGVGIYSIGLVLAVILTATSFWVANT